MNRDGRERDFTLNARGGMHSTELFLDETPQPLRKAIHEQLSGGRLERIHKLFKKGDNTFRVDYVRRQKPLHFVLTPAGKLESALVLLEDTPPAVQQTIRTRVGDGYIDEIELSMDEDAASYDVTFTQADAAKTLTVSASGQVEHSE